MYLSPLDRLPAIKKYYSEPLYRNSIALILSTSSGAIFGFLFWVVAARAMPARDIGLATGAISAAALLVSLSRLGLDMGLIRYLSQYRNKNRLYGTVLSITTVLSLLLAAVFFIGLEVFSPALSFLRNGWIPLLIILYVVLSSVLNIQNMALIALRKGSLSLVQNLILGVRIPLLFFTASLGVAGIFSAVSIAYMLSIIFGIYMLYRLGIFSRFQVDLASLKELWQFSLGNYFASIIAIAPVTVIPIIIINVAGANEGAYFYIAYSIASLLFVIPGAIATSLLVEGSHDLPLRDNVIKSVKFIAIVLVPLLFAIFIFGDKLLLLFSKEYSDQSLEILKMLALSSLFMAVISIYTAIKNVQKNTRAIYCVNLAISVLLIGLGYLFLLRYGLRGLGYAWLITYAIASAVIVLMIIKRDRWV